MARTPSNMLPLGTVAPDFRLLDTVSGQMLSRSELSGSNGTLIMFICNHCPFVLHVNPEIVSIAETYSPQGIGCIAVSSNDVINYPEDSPENMKIRAKEIGYPFPYLYDENQDVAKSYDAACTPDFYLFDADDQLVYRGQLDDSRPGNGRPLTGFDLRHAMNCLLEKKNNQTIQKPSIGCNIKWK